MKLLHHFGIKLFFIIVVKSVRMNILVFLGSAFGLSVRINIEQYEYIKGPNPDAGIKVHCLFKPTDATYAQN